MAMHLNGIDRDKIRKQGRWSSDTFLMYIHEQISAFSAGLSARMSVDVGWFNMEGPTLTIPPQGMLSVNKHYLLFGFSACHCTSVLS